MDGHMAGSIGAGIASAAKEIQRGVLQAYDIRTRRELQAREQRREDVLAAQRAGADKQSSELKDLQIQTMQLQLKQLINNNTKKETYEAFSAYRATNGDIKHLNKLFENPEIRKRMGGVTGMYKIDISAPQDRELLKKHLGLTDEVIDSEDFDPIRYVKATIEGQAPGTFDIVDLYGAYAKTGYFNTMRKEEVDELALKTKQAQLRQSKAQAGLKEIEVESAGQWLKDNPTKTYQDYLQVGKQTTSRIERKGQYQRQIDTFDRNNPNATPEERDNYIDLVMEKSVFGVAANRDERSVSNLTGNQLEAINLVGSPEYNTKDALRLENAIMASLSSTKRTLVKKDLVSMKANHKLSMFIERILKETKAGEVEVDKDIIANVETYMSKIFGRDTPQALLNVDFNTASGLLLAQFMKEISGTAVGVEEARRLMNIFQGGDLADEVFVKQAMRKFASESREANEILKANNKHYVPESVTRLTTYEEPEKEDYILLDTEISDKSYDTQYEKFKSLIGQINPNTGKKLIGIEETYPFGPIYEETE